MAKTAPTSKLVRAALSKEAVGLIHGFRSGLEEKAAAQIKAAGLPVLYEQAKVHYVWPEQNCTYTPDFPLPNGIIVETKGRFLTEDRQKHKHVKVQHPGLDVRFVFSNAHAKLSKKSSTSYAAWCEQYGFGWANKTIPEAWLKEPACPLRIKAWLEAIKGPKKASKIHDV